MSFEVYLQSYEAGVPVGLRRATVRSLLPVVDDESEADYWLVRYGAQDACHIGVQAVPTDPDLLTSLCVFRPCRDIRLWEALMATMRLGHVLLYFAGCRCPMVAAEAAVAHLPAGLTESLGWPLVVRNAHQVIEEVSR